MKLFLCMRNLAFAIGTFIFALMTNPKAHAQDAGEQTFYVGTYTGKSGSKGIYAFRLSRDSGVLTPLGLVAETTNPAYLCIATDRRHLYAVNEISKFGGKDSGAVSAFSINETTSQLTLINQQPTGGSGSCFLSTGKDGHHVFVANYGGGSVAVLPIAKDGSLEEPSCIVPHRPADGDTSHTHAHAHCILPDPAQHFVLASDLGLDQVKVYRFDAASGNLEPNEPPFATLPNHSGPRHLAFSAEGKFLYLCNEMGNSVTAFRYDATAGNLTAIQTIRTVPDDYFSSNTTAQIALHPNGRLLYVSNRGDDSIASFEIAKDTGKLTPITRTPTLGKTPRHFAIDPSGQFLIAANQQGNSIVVFRIDSTTGKLTAGDTKPLAAPVCVAFL